MLLTAKRRGGFLIREVQEMGRAQPVGDDAGLRPVLPSESSVLRLLPALPGDSEMSTVCLGGAGRPGAVHSPGSAGLQVQRASCGCARDTAGSTLGAVGPCPRGTERDGAMDVTQHSQPHVPGSSC